MKQLKYAAIAIAGLAGLWTAGWFVGLEYVAKPAADAQVERLRAGDMFFSYKARESSGFPLGWTFDYRDARIADASGLWSWEGPGLRIQTSVDDPGALTLSPSAGSRATVNLGEETIGFDIASEGLTARLSGEGDAAALAVKAARLTATQNEAGYVSDARIHLEDLAAAVDFAAGSGAYVGEGEAAAMEVAYRLSIDGVTGSHSRTRMDDVEIVFESDLRGANSLAELIAADGSARVRLAARRYEGEGGSTGGPSAPPVSVLTSGGASAIELSVGEGRARYSAESEGVAASFRYEAPAPLSRGAFTMAAGRAAMDMPIAKGGPAPYELSLALEEVSLDDETWAAVDPAGALRRDPIELAVDFGGEARVLTDFSAVAAAAGPPIDVETLDIRKARLSLLGASVEATGRLEIAGVAAQPDGEITVKLTRALELVGELVAAGFLPPQAAEAYGALAQEYAAPGDAPDELVSRIISRNGVVTANGKLLAQ